MRRAAVAVAWTIALAAGLWRVDRALLSPPAPRGWVAAATLDEVPPAVGPVALPAYLPGRFEWPPRVMRFRTGAHPGWWLGVYERGAVESSLWIGTGDPPLPAALPDGAACVHAASSARCPGAWRELSRRLSGGQVVYVITTIAPVDATRVLQGLQHTETSR